MSEKQTVSSPKKKMPAAVVLCAVALTACIGIGAAFVLRDDKDEHIDPPNIGNSQGSQGTSKTDTPTATYKVVCDNVEGDLQSKFKGADDIPSLKSWRQNRIMKAESGWYYVRHVQMETGSYRRIFYQDAATGEEVALCARPECTHNNEYCVAENTKYSGIPQTYYDGWLYGVSLDTSRDDPEEQDPDKIWFSGGGAPVLVRYAPDGTELERLVDFADVFPENLDRTDIYDVEMVGHRGGLWISALFERSYVIESDDTALEHHAAQGYGLFHYDIASGKMTLVAHMPLTKDAHPQIPHDLRGVGDYLYFRTANVDWQDPLNGDNVCRVNIRTGAVEKVVSGAVQYAIGNERVLFLEARYLSGDRTVYQVKQLELATGEESLFRGEDEYAMSIQATDDYVFVCEVEPAYHVSVYDWAGTLLQTIGLPEHQQYDSRELGSVAAEGDTLYAAFDDAVYSTSLTDVIEYGKTDWKLLHNTILDTLS